jgi:hypothetical protein
MHRHDSLFLHSNNALAHFFTAESTNVLFANFLGSIFFIQTGGAGTAQTYLKKTQNDLSSSIIPKKADTPIKS